MDLLVTFLCSLDAGHDVVASFSVSQSFLVFVPCLCLSLLFSIILLLILRFPYSFGHCFFFCLLQILGHYWFLFCYQMLLVCCFLFVSFLDAVGAG